MFEYVKNYVIALAAAGYFSQSLNKKINEGDFELRESDLVAKRFINGASGSYPVLVAGNRVEGVNDFDSGQRLNLDRAFVATSIRVDMGNTTDANAEIGAVALGGLSVPEVNEAKLIIRTEDKTVYDRTVSAITKGIASDLHKMSQPEQQLKKLLVLKDEATQDIVLKFAPNVSVPAKAENINKAFALRLDGFEIIGK